MNKFDVLLKYFGYKSFKEGQESIIDSLINNLDVLCVMPTGAGKSICYQVPAILSEGITVIISPLISLMKDQVNSLMQNGIEAAYLNSSLTQHEYIEILRRFRKYEYKIIYVAPERLESSEFIEVCKNLNIRYIAVDEAHCISQWGQDFRPSYLKISEFIYKLSKRPTVGAFTATATKEVKEDIIKLLQLNNPFQVTTGFDRPNLSFSVIKPKNKLSSLISLLEKYKEKSGIVYCSTRKIVEEVSSSISDLGYEVTKYHAGLTVEERRNNQENFMEDKKKIIVATNAFGMGIDKTNVSFVIHYNMPKNIESYYQEAGRAGRDGEKADCILLYSGSDVAINNFLIENSQNNSEKDSELIRDKDRYRLKQMTYYCTTSDCLRSYILKYFGENAKEYCDNCSNCKSGFDLIDYTIEAQKIISCVIRTGCRFGKGIIIDILLGKNSNRILELGFDSLSTFGIMSNIKEKDVKIIINHLLLEGFLDTTNSKYPTLILTDKSKLILTGQYKFEIKIPKDRKIIDNRSVIKNNFNDPLFNELKILRNKIAKSENVPAYIIFNDASLKDMIIKMPKTKEEFLNVSGVGNIKLERYGEDFLKVLNTSEDSVKIIENNVKGFQLYKQNIISDGFIDAYKPWKAEEDIQLKEEFKNNTSIAEMSTIHKRTNGAIKSRLKKLMLINDD